MTQNEMLAIPVTIKNGGTSSAPIRPVDSGVFQYHVIAGIITPATVDATTIQIDYSLDGSTWLSITDDAGNAETITQGANKFIWLSPIQYSCVAPYLRITAGGAVAADRTYKIVFREAK